MASIRGSLTPRRLGNYALQFPDGTTVNVEVLSAYGFTEDTFQLSDHYGERLDLGDDSVAQIYFAVSHSIWRRKFQSVIREQQWHH